MDILGPRMCEKHKMQANRMCTRHQCFLQADILICPECSSKHFDHQQQIIQINLLNDKVHELMKKRMQFESTFQVSCQALINELKKFKIFKQELVTSLNIRERILNDMCKKIKRNIAYEKDKQLFKHHFGYIFLTMKGINPNTQIYNKFRSQITQTITSCRNILRKFQFNCGNKQIPSLRLKQHQISSILKKNQYCQNQPKFYAPDFQKFKKQTIKFKSSAEKASKILRVSNEEFFVAHGDSFSWYNCNNFLFPKTYPISKNKINNIALLEKNAFITTQESQIYIYDMINQRLLKQYTSSNHKSAIITDLLSIPNSMTVLNFINCPNQIVSLNFNQNNGSLRVIKGVQTQSKQIQAKILHDNFIVLSQNKVVDIYKTQHLQKQRQFHLQKLMKTIDKLDDNTFIVGGESDEILLLDNRQKNIVMKIHIDDYCSHITKIYPYSFLANSGKNLKIFDIRKHKQIFTTRIQQQIKALSVINSQFFVTSGNTLTLWSTV